MAKDIKIFYSWQSDDVAARKMIHKAIDNVLKDLSKDNPRLKLVTDSRDGKGSEDITEQILLSIRESKLFIGDLTPVVGIDVEKEVKDHPQKRTKLQPNSNVMFEYGYAAGKIGIEHCKQIIGLHPEKGERIEDIPFDIKQRSSILFTVITEPGEEVTNETKKLTGSIKRWLKERLYDILLEESIDEQPVAKVTFGDGSDDITLHPRFEKVFFINPATEIKRPDLPTESASSLAAFTGINAAIAKMSRFNIAPTVKFSVVEKSTNESYCPLRFELVNEGIKTIDDIQVILELPATEGITFRESNVENKGVFITALPSAKQYWISDDGKRLTYKRRTLNPNMRSEVADCWIELPTEEAEIQICCTISSRDNMPVSNTLKLHSQPTYDDKYERSESKAGQTEIRTIIRDE